MPSSWLPLKDAELVPFAQNFSAKISATPTVYNLTAADATALAALLTTFLAAWAAVSDPATRTEMAITNKEVAKAALVAAIRSYAKRIQAYPSVTPAQKDALHLPVHKTTPSPIPAPATKPVLSVANIASGRIVTINLADQATPTKKAKPFGVDGAEVYSYVPAGDEDPPADLEKWRFEGIAKKATFDVGFNESDVQKTAYICAVWFSPRGEPGPVSEKVSATVAA